MTIAILLGKLWSMGYINTNHTEKKSPLKDAEQKGAIVIFRLVLVGEILSKSHNILSSQKVQTENYSSYKMQTGSYWTLPLIQCVNG